MRSLRRNSVLAARAGDTAASNRAAELIGKHLNMFVDRKEIQINYVDDADEYLAKLLELVGQPVLEHEPQQLEHDADDGRKDGSGPEPEGEAIYIIEEMA
jgi:hypothetical protein